MSEKGLNSQDFLFDWISCPLHESTPFKNIALIVLIFFCSWLIGYSITPVYGIVGAILLFISLGKYFIPTKYFISDDEIKVNFIFFNKSCKWDYYVRYNVGRDGIFLSPFLEPSRLDSFRGAFLRYGNGVDRDNLKRFIKEKISND